MTELKAEFGVPGEHPAEPVPARGSDANYCSAYPAEGHHMVSRSTGGEKVRWIEICSLCSWIDGAALDGWADNAIKESMTRRAQRIAVSAGTEPFAFVQPSSGDLDIQEILGQALGAASMCWEHPDRAGIFDSVRASDIYQRLLGEVERYAKGVAVKP